VHGSVHPPHNQGTFEKVCMSLGDMRYGYNKIT